jgi:predicted metal-dependent hydrolase
MDPEERLRLMAEGRDAFNRGEFYEAHEHWEEVWDVIDDPDRTWVQGLIQIATGLHKLDRGRPDVAETLLTKALHKLDSAPPTIDRLDVLDLRRQAFAVLSAVKARRSVEARGVKIATCDAKEG